MTTKIITNYGQKNLNQASNLINGTAESGAPYSNIRSFVWDGATDNLLSLLQTIGILYPDFKQNEKINIILSGVGHEITPITDSSLKNLKRLNLIGSNEDGSYTDVTIKGDFTGDQLIEFFNNTYQINFINDVDSGTVAPFNFSSSTIISPEIIMLSNSSIYQKDSKPAIFQITPDSSVKVYFKGAGNSISGCGLRLEGSSVFATVAGAPSNGYLNIHAIGGSYVGSNVCSGSGEIDFWFDDQSIVESQTAGNINTVLSDTDMLKKIEPYIIKYQKTKGLVNRFIVGPNGDFLTLKSAVNWFNASSFTGTDVEILLDAGHHNISDTIVVSNNFQNLQIRGLGSAVTFLDAALGLANKPMFEIKSNCDINKVTASGATLFSYGFNPGEDFVQITTNTGTYHEFKDIFIDTFNIGIKDAIGSSLFIFDFYISNCISQGVEINHTGSGELDAEVGTIENCPIGFDLISATVAEDIFLNSIYYINANPTDVAINYDGTAVTYTNFSIINGNWNKVGFFISGFDFHRTDGRDSNIEMISNVGYEDKNAHSKMNVVDNTTLTTTLTAANTYYKVTGVRSETRIIFNAAATSGNFTITYGGQTTGNIAYNASAADIKTALEALSNITTVTVTQVTASKEWKIRFDTDGEGFEWTQSVDISGLGTTTSVDVLKSFYGCKIGFGFGKMIYQSEHGKDGVMWISGNVQVNQINRNITLGLKKNNTGQIISPMTVRTSTSNQPVSFSLIAYLDDIEQNDYFEIFASSANSGDVIILQDLTWYFEAR